MADAWNEGTWGQGFWGQQSSVTVTLTGVSSTTALGTASATADVSVPPSPVTLTSTLGTPTAEPEHVISPTGVSFETQLSGALAIEEGAGVVLGSLTVSFAVGDESGSGTVDAGWGRGSWGSFAWNENIEFITNVSGLSMSTSLGTTTQSVGTGVIVSATGLSMTSAAGTLEVSEATALVNPTALTIGAALSGVTVSGEGSVGVIAPSDQLDFNIGTVTIDIFTQVDAPSVAMTSALGTAVAEADAVVTLGSLSSSFALGTETVTGGAVVDLTGLSMATALGDPFSTPWANVVTGASNTWTEVNAA